MFWALAVAVTMILISAGEVFSASFTDITASSGTGGPGWYGGHGVQFGDATGDGRPDIYVTMNADQDMADLFYRNSNGTSFVEEGNLRGAASFDTGSHGGVWADLDNDGDYDLFNGAYQRNRIYRNNGSGFFTDVTAAAQLPDRQWLTRAVLAFDMDGDGDLDLFAVTGYQGTNDAAGEKNEVYRNNGNMVFTAVNSGALYDAPAGQGATDSDFDGDGDIDIIAANRTGAVNILRNDGAGNFQLVSPASLGINHTAGDGISLADVNNDGHLDLLLQKTLYLNAGNNTYVFKKTFTAPGYMGGFEDLDNDGDWDLVFTGDNKVYYNDGSGNYSASATFATGLINDPRAMAFADIEGDGDVDFFYAQKNTYSRLIRNDYQGGNRWLEVKLVRSSGQAGAYGAKVYIYNAGQLGASGSRVTWREARSQEGYLGQNDPVLHFGVGPRDQVDVRVVFLGGATVEESFVAAGQTITVNESGIISDCVLDARFGQASLAAGLKYYTDRDYVLTAVPSAYSGMTTITTPNDDRDLTASTGYLNFEMPFDGTVYVAYDSRATALPDWMNGFASTGATIETSLSTQPHLLVYGKTFAAGDCVNLGANKAAGFAGGTVSSYIVFYGASGPPPVCVLDARFGQASLAAGLKYYTDRDYVLTAVPSAYSGMTTITTPNDDRDLTRLDGLPELRDALRRDGVRGLRQPGDRSARLDEWICLHRCDDRDLPVDAAAPAGLRQDVCGRRLCQPGRQQGRRLCGRYGQQLHRVLRRQRAAAGLCSRCEVWPSEPCGGAEILHGPGLCPDRRSFSLQRDDDDHNAQ